MAIMYQHIKNRLLFKYGTGEVQMDKIESKLFEKYTPIWTESEMHGAMIGCFIVGFLIGLMF